MRSTRRQILLVAVACLLSATIACSRGRFSSAERDFSVVGAAPRVLVAGDEITVPLTLTNTGAIIWNPAAVHLSYHWLWFIPRELAHRSRVLPYHEGIRTSLPAAVPPHRTIGVGGRVLAPATPGVYWLQWDMVEEGVTWFVQVAPRQPRHLVIVVPPLAVALAPLPLIVAVVGLVGLRRARRRSWSGYADAADVWWCVAVLFAKPLVLYRDALLEPTAIAYCLTAIVAIIVPALAFVLLPRRLRPPVLAIVGCFATMVIVADVIYYRFFGDILSAPAVLAAHQTGRVWATIRSLLSPELVWLVLDLPFAVALAVALTRSPFSRPISRRTRTLAAVSCVVAAAIVGAYLSASPVLATSQLDQMFRNRTVVEQLGAFGFHAYDAWSYVRNTILRPRATPEEIDATVRWFLERASLRAGAGPAFGVAKGKNLIVIQVESLQDFVVDHVVNGQEVMPNLRRWTSDALRFRQVTDQTSEGRTSDAEFTTMVSLLPIEHGAVAFRFPGNHYVGLPRVLAEQGYATLSAVAFEPGFWNRAVMHPAYGFQHTLFENDFAPGEQIGWGLNDRDFLQQMLPRLADLPRPFCAWLITLSLHHPFADFPDAHKVLKLGTLEGTSFGNYLHTMHFFDEALAAFVQGLSDHHLLDDSVIVVFGDHDAGFPREPAIADAIGIGADPLSWSMADRIPWFIRVPAAAGTEPLRGPRDGVAGQTDMAPTVLALLGVDPARLPYMGRNLLGGPDDPPILRPYGDWIDREYAFFSRGLGTRDQTCYELNAGFVAPDRCRADNDRARLAREASRLTIAEDLQQVVRARLR